MGCKVCWEHMYSTWDDMLHGTPLGGTIKRSIGPTSLSDPEKGNGRIHN
jgi:hypothetical protein